MNRCLRSTLASTLLTTALLALANTAFAQEAVRPFPAAAKRATLQVTYPPDILLNGQPARLSPGARIRGINNMLVLSGSLAGQTLLVNYVKDAQGMVHEVWVLNNTEAQQKQEGSSLPPNYVTDAVTASGEASSVAVASSSTQP
nr:hypothetical protein [Rhodoferax sp.]